MRTWARVSRIGRENGAQIARSTRLSLEIIMRRPEPNEDVGCSVVLIINKWDTQKRNKDFTREVASELIRKEMAFLRYAPILFTSAIRSEGFEELGSLFEEILHQQVLAN